MDPLQFLRGSDPVFFVGTSKNSGKTTALNALLRIFRKTAGVPPGIISTGVDGEKVDAIYGFEKPAVPVEEDDIICTSGAALDTGTADSTILEALDFGEGPEQMFIVRIVKPGTMLLIGPDKNTQLSAAVSALARNGAGRIFIDGAIDRSTQIGIGQGVSVVLCAALRENEDENSFAVRVAERAGYYGLPVWDEKQAPFAAAPGEVILTLEGNKQMTFQSHQFMDTGDPNAIRPEKVMLIQVGGAFTQQLWESLPKNKTAIFIVADPSRVFVSHSIFSRLVKEDRIFSAQQTRLELVTIRSTGMKGLSLDPFKTLEAVQKKLAPIPVIDIILSLPGLIKQESENEW